MEFQEYQTQSRQTAHYPDAGNNFVYPTLGLCGEAGEIAEKIKKVLRDNEGEINQAKKEEMKKELGDVLWYLSQVAFELGIDLEEVAQGNLEKLRSRQARGVIQGDGDNR